MTCGSPPNGRAQRRAEPLVIWEERGKIGISPDCAAEEPKQGYFPNEEENDSEKEYCLTHARDAPKRQTADG